MKDFTKHNEKEIFRDLGISVARLIAQSINQLIVEKEEAAEGMESLPFDTDDLLAGDFWNNSKVIHISKLINIFKIINDLNSGNIQTIEDNISDASEDAIVLQNFVERELVRLGHKEPTENQASWDKHYSDKS